MAELAAATKGLVVPVNIAAAGGKSATTSVQKVAVAQKELAAATRTATVATEQQVSVQRVAAATAAAEARAQRVSAKAATESAAAHEALARGAGASVLSLGGVRGATLAASAPFLIGAAAVTILAKSLKEASKEQEALARATAVFGDEAKQLQSNAKGFIGTFALDPEDALLVEGAIGNILKTAGLAEDQIGGLSESLVKLGADMAAFNNVPLETTLKAIQLGIVGNSRGLRQFGIELGAATVNQEALRLSGKKNVDELTRGERVQARINILFAQTTTQQGAAARRSKDFAQQTKILSAQVQDLGADLGHLLVPALNSVVQEVNLTLGSFKKLIDFTKDLAPATKDAEGKTTLFGKALHGLAIEYKLINPATVILGTKDLIDLFRGGGTKEVNTAAEAFAQLNAAIQGTLNYINALLAQTGKINFQRATAEIGRLQDKLLDLQFRDAAPEAQIANLQAQLAEQVSIIANPPSVKAKTAAKEERNRLQDQIRSILEEQKQKAADTADAAQSIAEQIAGLVEDARQKVQDLLDRADQAFLDMVAFKQGEVNLAVLRADRTKSLVDDVAAQKQLQVVLVAAISEAKRTISNEQLRAQTIQQLTATLIQTNTAIKALEAQQAANRQQRRNAAFERAAESVDLDIQLAQTDKNIRAEIAARQRRIRLDEEREKAVKGDILATKRLRNDIAEQRAAITELRKQLAARNNAFRELSFEFLQTQTGFAANLISNLIPGGATAGLVGGTAGAISTPTSAGGPSRPPDVGAGLGSAAQTSGPRGATTGQMSALIEIQRRTLQVLTRLAGEQTHPEAKNQKIAQAVSMDIINW